MQTVAIVGVGLIGGSFALALKQAGFSGRILGVSSERTLREALPLGVIDEPATLDEAAERADLIYLAQPIHGIISTLTELHGKIRPDCLVTDAGSTKVNIVRHAISTVTASQFLGGHPMAGKESRGVLAADANLFRGKTYVLTPIGDDVLKTSLALAFLKWLTEIGAQTITLTPEEHDQTVAFTSHLPQLISSALAATLGEHLNSDEQLRVAGSGLADTTRLALSSYDIWRDILETNTAEVDHALAVYIDKLTKFRQNLTTPQLRDEFCVAAEMANKLRR